MNKTELIAKVKEALTTDERKVTKDEATKAVDAVLDAIADALKSGDKVQLNGFGNFEVRERAARKGVNPKLLKELKEQGVDEVTAKEQAQVEIAATKVPAFKPAKALKESVK